jgi:hypothetical protein
MRIVFITSCLEPGRDGVGDYTRDLAAGCLAQGYDARVIALNDPDIDVPVEEVQTARGAVIETLRLPSSQSWHDRMAAARGFLQQRPPVWVSLQFVPYGFHPKGMVIGLGRRLEPLVADRRVHVMFHETWIGTQRTDSLRKRIVGSIQRWAVSSLIAELKPAAVHTSNRGYVRLLSRFGIDARLLPLCGSIPIAADVDTHWLEQEMSKLGVVPAAPAPAGGWWRFGFFGVLPDLWSPEPLFTYIAEAAERAQRAVAVISIGRIGPGERLWHELRARYEGRFCFGRLGERSTADVSRFLQSIDFGIATTPWQLIGKSAGTAAMLDHGVPVIVSRDDVDLGAHGLEPDDPLLQRMGGDLPEWLLHVRRRAPGDRLAAMSERFTAELRAADVNQHVAAGRGSPILHGSGRVL